MAIIPIWQPVGYSTNQIAVKIAAQTYDKGTHSGTLDPMAEGVLIVLTAEDRFKKFDLASWKKTYEFEMIFGIRTDSFDTLGMIKEEREGSVDIRKFSEILKSFEGNYSQEVPIYSAIKQKGKKLFQYAKEGLIPPSIPVKTGIIYKIDLLSYYKLNGKDLVKNILMRLENIHGEFRQKEIIDQWKLYNSGLSEKKIFEIAKIKVEISRGMYVRSLSQDIAKSLGELGMVYTLVRTQNGKYKKEDCKTLKDIFGPNYDMLFRLDG